MSVQLNSSSRESSLASKQQYNYQNSQQPQNMDFMHQHTQLQGESAFQTPYEEMHQPLKDMAGEDFDEEHSDQEKNGVVGSVFSYICTCVGAGVLSLPGALQQCGWIGLLVMALVAFGCNHTAKYLIACQFARPGKILKTYEDIGELALGIWGRRAVAFFQAITLFGVCTIFLIIIGGNMTTLVPKLSLHDWVFIFGAVLIPVAWLKTMNEVAYLAVFGVLASLYVAGVVIVKGFLRAADPEGDATISYQTFDIKGLSNAINIIVFSFGGHSVLPNIVSHLRQPKQNYRAVTGWSYFLIALIYMLTAAGGYAGWGRDVDGKILDNMNDDSIVVKLAFAAITAHVVMAYPIPLNPVSLAVESVFGIDKKTGMTELVWRCSSRTCLVLLTVFIASVVPYFGDILSLVSSLSIVVVVFVFPPMFYYLLYRHTLHFSEWDLSVMIFIIIFGVVASVIGVYYAISGLITDINNNPNPFANYF